MRIQIYCLYWALIGLPHPGCSLPALQTHNQRSCDGRACLRLRKRERFKTGLLDLSLCIDHHCSGPKIEQDLTLATAHRSCASNRLSVRERKHRPQRMAVGRSTPGCQCERRVKVVAAVPTHACRGVEQLPLNASRRIRLALAASAHAWWIKGIQKLSIYQHVRQHACMPAHKLCVPGCRCG
jgi:hypothetical protein